MWKELTEHAAEAGKSVAAALDSAKQVDAHMASYEKVRKGEDKAVRATGWQSTQLFVASTR